MKIENVYTSIGVNRTLTSLDWGNNGLIAYGAANSIAILNPSYQRSCKLLAILAAHKDRVNSVKWVRRNDQPEYELISGSDDSKCIYWNLKDIHNPTKIVLEAHKSGVTSVDAIFVGSELTIATSSAGSTVRLWRFKPETVENESVSSLQVFPLSTGICFAVKLWSIPQTGILLAFATDDDKIHLHGENQDQCFNKLESLTGHEDWVRGLDFTTDDNGDVLLATSSQDSFIRLWRISEKKEETEEVKSDLELIQVEERTFKFAEKKFILSLESVLQGHENWVYSVNWCRNDEDNSLQLLSSSMDKSMIIWTIDREQALWTEKIRVGDVGGNSLGFYGAKFSSDGKSIVGHGFQASLHLWHQSKVNERLWEPGVINGGHYKEVRDIGWEPNGEFLFSASVDQTTRIHAMWNHNNSDIKTYHEIARPQVHGYDMQCLAVLSRFKFASAAEEKIVRTFQAPGNFVENFRNLVNAKPESEGDEILKTHQKGASVPSLGLSNKAVYEEEIGNENVVEKSFKDEYPENYFVPMTMTVPPTEEYLTQNTLWPELQKLYAHGYELFSLAATRNGKLLASACKATTVEHAEIILWNTNTWKVVQRLRTHKLTVTQMKFSSDSKRLLSVSRDRRWSLFENKSGDDDISFELVATTDKSNGVHERLIWTCSWSHDDKFFVTGSRDGKVAAWCKSEVVGDSTLKDYQLVATLNLSSSSVTALSFAQKSLGESYLLAIGLENGIIHLYKFNEKSFELLRTLNHSEAHHACVNKLEFRPNSGSFELASCGNDHLVRIYELKL